MNDQELKALWKSQPLDVDSVSLDAIRDRAEGFHTIIMRRNRQEELAGYLVMLIFGVLVWFLESMTLRIGCVLSILGALVMLYQLRKRASIGAMPANGLASTYVEYFRAELIRQQAATRAICLWGIFPAVPGLAVLVWGMAEKDPWGFPWLPMLAMLVVPMAVVWWMNLRVARQMQQKIDELDAIAR